MSHANRGGRQRLMTSLALVAGLAVGPLCFAPVGAAQSDGAASGQPASDPEPTEVIRMLGADSTRAAGFDGLLAVADRLEASEAAPWLELAMLVDRVPDDWLAGAGSAVLRAHEGDPEGALDDLVAQIDSVVAAPARDRSDDIDPGGDADDSAESDRETGLAPLLGLAASVAGFVDPDRAAELHRRLLEHRPAALEAPRAALALGRHLLGQRERAGEGLQILEELLVRTPTHPVAPEARRLRQAALARGVELPGSRSGAGRR